MSAFYVPKREYRNKTVRLPAELIEKMSTLAQNRNLTFTHLLIQCCEYALENLKNEE